MPYEINADKYAFAQTPQPEKVCENYNAVLIRKQILEEANKREILKSILEQNLANEVYARTDGDIDLKARINSERLSRETAVSEVDAKLGAEIQERTLKDEELNLKLTKEIEQRAAADASILEALDNLEADLSGEVALRQVADNELMQTLSQKADAKDVYTKISALEEAISCIEEGKEESTIIITDNAKSNLAFNILGMHNTEYRCVLPLESLSLEFDDGEYPANYISSLSFNCGEGLTEVSYPASAIITWVGTDCVTSEGISVFQPSADTHYDIVFYFNGSQFIALVNGYIPAPGNEAV